MATIRIYRITHRRYAEEPFSGKGGLYAAGRWASQGRLVSYAAGSLALATLEQLARAGSGTRLREMVYTTADLDEDAIIARRRDDLPAGWDRRPPGKVSREIGDEWLIEGPSVALAVPSVLLPQGANYLLNPAHSGFDEALTVHETSPLGLDERILERFGAIR